LQKKKKKVYCGILRYMTSSTVEIHQQKS